MILNVIPVSEILDLINRFDTFLLDCDGRYYFVLSLFLSFLCLYARNLQVFFGTEIVLFKT